MRQPMCQRVRSPGERPIRRWSVPRVREGSLPHEADLIRVSPTAHRPKHRLVCRPMEEVITDEDETDRDRGGRGGVTGVARRGGPRQDAGGRSEHTCSVVTADHGCRRGRHPGRRIETTADSGTEATSEAGGEQPTKTEGGSAPSPTDPEVMRMPRATWTISSTGRSVVPSVPTEGGSGAAGRSLTPWRPDPVGGRKPNGEGSPAPGRTSTRSGRRVPPRSRC